MNFLSKLTLSQIQFYLSGITGDVVISLNSNVPVSVLQATAMPAFYYYQNNASKQEILTKMIIGSDIELPLLSDNIDCFILWDNLNAVDQSKALLKEIWRSLSPNGVLILVDANSPCFFKRNRSSLTQIKRLEVLKNLKQLGFSIEVQKSFGFRPNIKQSIVCKFLQPLEIIGQFLWPFMGSNYLFLARKPILGASVLIDNKEKAKKIQPLPGLAAPTSFK